MKKALATYCSQIFTRIRLSRKILAVITVLLTFHVCSRINNSKQKNKVGGGGAGKTLPVLLSSRSLLQIASNNRFKNTFIISSSCIKFFAAALQ